MTKKFLFFLLFAILAIGTFLFAHPFDTLAAGNLYLSPGSKTVAAGSKFSVAVRVNSGGDPINAVQANLVYPAALLDFAGISAGGSSFEIQAEGSGGGGGVRIARGTVSAKTGDRLVATVTFKAKASSGTATVGFAGGSAVVRSTDNAGILGGTSGGTYTLSAASTSDTPPAQDADAPKISEVRVEDISKNSATILWKTDKQSTSTVEYGLNSSYGLVASSSDLVFDHKIVLSSPFLLSGVTFHFRVLSEDAQGKEAVGEDQTFTILGYSIKIRVIDNSGRPLKGAAVLVYSHPQKAESDENGFAVFENMALGEHLVVVEYKGKKEIQEIEVKELDGEQSFDLKLTKAGWPWFKVLALGLTAFLLLVIGVILWKKFRRINNLPA